jgi:lipoate-protein ligase A
MEFHVLPERTGDAAGNMATDFLLLQRYPQTDAIRFRHYAWRRPAFTFGYGQEIALVRAKLPPVERLDVTRRASGGGIVDHRHDWTYALVLPRRHPLFERPGPAIYERVHASLVTALAKLGASVTLQRLEPTASAGLCFDRPEISDVVRTDDGRKVAGAALKRGKHALLLQGSIAREVLPEISDWTQLVDALAQSLSDPLAAPISRPGWPEFTIEEEEALVEQYASPEWIERR